MLESSSIGDARALAERYRCLFRSAPLSIYVLDQDGFIVDVNPYHVRQFGRGRTSVDDYLTRNALDRPTIVRAGLTAVVERVLDGYEIDERDVFLPTTSGGASARVDIRGAPLMDEQGNRRGAVFLSSLVAPPEESERTQALVPICASCKLVKDERGEWRPLDALVRARLGSALTHGFCPVCIARLYPEIDETDV